MSCSFDFHLVDENATVAMGNKLAAIIEQGAVIYLQKMLLMMILSLKNCCDGHRSMLRNKRKMTVDPNNS